MKKFKSVQERNEAIRAAVAKGDKTLAQVGIEFGEDGKPMAPQRVWLIANPFNPNGEAIELTCQECEAVWETTALNKPATCPVCNTRNWDASRKTRSKVRIISKGKFEEKPAKEKPAKGKKAA